MRISHPLMSELVGCGIAALIVVCTAAIAAESSSTSRSAKIWNAPRTEHGYPDFQGIWTNATITPLERPARYGDRLVLTQAEATVLEQNQARAAEQGSAPSDLTRDLPRAADGVGSVNNFWFDRDIKVATVNGEQRSSLIIDPKNGRVPLSPERRNQPAGSDQRTNNFDGPEARDIGERCLLSLGSSAGPPMLPVGYNNHHQIVQTKDTVMILAEMMHDARVIRIGGTRVPKAIRKWMGDSVGRYDGDTLIVETTQFAEGHDFRGAGSDRKITERFTRVSDDTIVYQATIEDPTALTQPWTVEYPMHATTERIYEYACHEGNYALPGILAGAREQERAAGGSAKKK